jgi:hypothetical protein
MAEIKDIVIEEAAEYGDVPGGGHPSLPGSAYPGHSVGYPTCSEPSRTNSLEQVRNQGGGALYCDVPEPKG